ncbi:MAG: putative nucleic acid-binding Zn-ribbon protein [Planctomycetota bacterium]|jgi:predicted  nucleic acid-binding Zn-ribbon protein
MEPANDDARDVLSDQIIASLEELNRLDFEIGHGRRAMDRRPKEIAARARQVAEQEAVVLVAKNTVTATQKMIDKKCLEIDTIAQDILRLEGQLFSLKNNDEFNAMKSQISTRKAKDDNLQTEVLELYEVMETLKGDHDETLEKLTLVKGIADHSEDKAKAEAQAQADKVGTMDELRQVCFGKLSGEVRAAYDEAYARHNQGTGLVIDQICKGCDTQITLQTLTHVMARKLVTCRNCQRVLVLGVE